MTEDEMRHYAALMLYIGVVVVAVIVAVVVAAAAKACV